MSGHYYSEKPEVESNQKDWSAVLRNEKINFYSDRGVFSKKEVDFGSQLLIETFNLPEQEGAILDVGCGYGPIGLSVARLDPERTVHMVDVNERALELSEKNAMRNKITNVKIYKSNGLEGVEETFAAVLTNPPIRAGKQVVHMIFEQAYEKLAEGGELWVVIQKKQGAPSAIEKLESLFDSVEVVEKKKGYFILLAKKV
ncbi:class I SAM-dependent methyltransferase [Bacillus suaedae]|uniref:Class I SAM-dependent methyltransferase n=1 Tax=Halalkalibacter suaedae TaxID=2822140 RepID=A0A941ARW7_9BACI|nr:class I SAM-dependent methyltransferase [Bacillus suaedae]MBP3953398.1 class I SAM-dependent methyltransferase [Bacillus suaedae]